MAGVPTEDALRLSIFSTLLDFQYTYGQRSAMRDVLAAITGGKNPDRIGWSPSGIYIYWDPVGLRPSVVYVGKATDLAGRFADHNGLHPGSGAASKWAKLEPYLRRPEGLGVTLVVAPATFRRGGDKAISSYAKKIVAASPREVADLHKALVAGYAAMTTWGIATVESALITRYHAPNQVWPLLNDGPGAVVGRQYHSKVPVAPWVVRKGGAGDVYWARRSLVELARDDSQLVMEHFLTRVRAYYAYCELTGRPTAFQKAFDGAVGAWPDHPGIQMILDAGYLR